MAELIDVIRALDGRATRSQLLQQLSRRQLARAVSDGELLAVARGIYVSRILDPERRAAAACRGVLSHTSAAAALGLEVWLPDGQIHITVPHGARPPVLPGVVIHHTDLAPGEVAKHTTSPLRTVQDCARHLNLTQALAVADSAYRRGVVSPTEVAVCGRTARVATWMRATPDNGFESAVRGTLIDAGFTTFEPQVPVWLGFPARFDLADATHRVAVEPEGYQFHSDRSAFESDRERYAEAQRASWVIIPVTRLKFAQEPNWLVHTVSEVLAQRGAALPRARIRLRW